MSLISELKRRNVFKVAVAYAIVGWILVEVSSVLGPALNLPEWVTTFVAFCLILGFPVAMLLTWAYELTPEGMKKTHSVPLAESITHVTGRKLDFIIIALMAIAIGFLVLDNYVLDSTDPPELVQEEAAPSPDMTVQPVAPAGEPVDSTPPVQDTEREVLSNSVAVLPFENMSDDPEHAYFAPGIHEEILNQLVKLRELNVIARTSVLQYEGSTKTIPQIAGELNVEAVMEGSVRYADDRVLVTAQLIDPVTNAHLWSESYNREFADVFAIQADIAMNVANALEAEFSLEEQASIEKIPTDSPEAYRLYLLADQASGGSLTIEYLDQAIAADPNFAQAYVERASARLNLLRFDRTEEGFMTRRGALEAEVLRDLEKARTLDPDLGSAYTILGIMHAFNWRGAEARDAYEQAYQLSPNDTTVLRQYAQFFLSWTGQHERSIELIKRAVGLDPSASVGALSEVYDFALDRENAYGTYQTELKSNPSLPRALVGFGLLNIVRGNHDEATNTLRLAEQATLENPRMLAQVIYGYGKLGLVEDVERLLTYFDEMTADLRISGATKIWLSLATGDREEALDLLLEAAETKEPYDGPISLMRIKFNVVDDPTLNEPEFVEVREQLGFQDL